MIRLDTLRLRLPAEAARLDVRALATHPETLNDERRRSKRPRHFATLSGSEHLGFGIGRVQWDRLAGVVSLDVSAKALGDAYPEGITVNTLEELAEGLNRCGLVTLTPDALVSADVQWADAAVNLAVGREAIPDDFKALRILRTNLRHRLTDQGPASLLWKGPKGQNLRAYDKEAEIGKAANRPFLRSLSPSARRRLQGVVRFEREARGPARVKHYVPHAVSRPFVTLGEVLGSRRSPVADLFDQVRGATGQRELFTRSDELAAASGLKPGKQLVGLIYRRVGLETICEGLGWSFDAVKDWLRQYAGPKASELYDEARAVIEAHAAGPEAEQRARLFARLDDLAGALRLAA